MHNATKNQQIEFEVFPKENKTNYSYLSGVQGDNSNTSAQINVVFSHQSVIVIIICAIMLLVASFALGVEKGKLVAKNNLTPIQNRIEAEDKILSVKPESNDSKSETASKETIPTQTNVINTATTDNSIQNIVVENKDPVNTNGAYAIQIASVKSESAAKSLAETLTKKGISSFTRSSGKYTVVLAGNFAKKEEAQQSLKELRKSYSDCFIRKI